MSTGKGIQLRPGSPDHYETESDADERKDADELEAARDAVIEAAREHSTALTENDGQIYGHAHKTWRKLVSALARLDELKAKA